MAMFEFHSIYDFNTVSHTVLKPSYKHMKVVGIVDLDQAVKYSGQYVDVVTLREQIINETGLPLVDPRDAKYLIFEDENKNTVILAEDWIIPDSVVLVTSINLKIEIKNISSSDVTIIKNALLAMGYSDLELEVVNLD